MTVALPTDETEKVVTPEIAGITVIRAQLRDLTSDSGVYRMLDARQQTLYVGKACNLKARVQSYTRIRPLSARIRLMVSLTRAMEFITTHTEAEALLLEAELIKRLKPRFNILLRDDKSYPEVLLREDHPFSRLMKHRGKHSVSGQYFGPYANVQAVNLALDELQKSFLLRSCTDSVFAQRTRPCLLHDIKRCAAPCVGKVSREEYAALARQAQDFLRGRSVQVQAELARQMQEASRAMRYEQAGALRDRLAALTEMQKRNSLPAPHSISADVMALMRGTRQSCVEVLMFRHGRHCGAQAYFLSHKENLDEALEDREGEDFDGILSSFIGQFYQKRDIPHLLLLDRWPKEATLVCEALRRVAGHGVQMHVPRRGEKLSLIKRSAGEAALALRRKRDEGAQHHQQWAAFAALLELEEPQRIEVFDNSHLNGSNPVGVMVVAESEGFARESYRKFNIRGAHSAGDDYGFMREVLTRRLGHLSDTEQPCPDLLLIDGGRGQLGAAREVLEDSGLETRIALASIVKGSGRDARRDRLLFGKRDLMLAEYPEIGLFVQRLRDEAHRFAIGAQRVRRKMDFVRSRLDGIPNVGARRKKSLMMHFGSARAVAQAGVADIAAVSGISERLAEEIYRYFRE